MHRFQLLVPKKWWQSSTKPVVLHFAGTGDQYFWRRRVVLAKPLMNQYSVANLLIENPYYGFRRPPNQV